MNNFSAFPLVMSSLLALLWACNGQDDTDKKKTGDSADATLPQIFINEVMTSNTAAFPDETGAFEDWIELWNAEEETADISGWWITDDLGDIFKWQFPEGTTIPAGGYLVLFADEDQEEGPNHINFQLAADAGEDVGLFGPNVLDNPVVDAIEELLPITTDWSHARQPDGGPLVVDDTPTPGASNN